MTKIKSIGMAEARPKLTHLVNEVSESDDPYLIVSGSKIKAVFMGIDRYNEMIERLEDLSDTVALLQAQLDDEPVMTFEQHMRETGELQQSVSAGH